MAARGSYDYVIVGLGATGLSAITYLARQGFSVAAADTRELPPHAETVKQRFPTIPLFLGEDFSVPILSASTVVVSPGIAPNIPILQKARAKGVSIISDIELFVRAATCPVLAITGSNGKSTVTTLVGEMLRAQGFTVGVGGNLGTPALDLLSASTEVYVLELSSFQLEITAELCVHAATLLNLSEDHLDRHGTMEQYAAAKQRIYHGALHAVVNAEESASLPSASFSGTIHTFTTYLGGQADYHLMRDSSGATMLAHRGKCLLDASQLLIKGRHNYSNALAAIALTATLGRPMAPALAALRAFRGLPHRCEWVKVAAGVTYINDSKGTNVGATLAAIGGLKGDFSKLVLIAGGDGKGQDFSLLLQEQETLRGITVLGKDARELAEVFSPYIPVKICTTFQEAVVEAAKLACPGDAVLLSPACSSLDMFRNYADRGEQFVKIVESF